MGQRAFVAGGEPGISPIAIGTDIEFAQDVKSECIDAPFIDHGNGMQTVYNHLGSLWVSSGAYVTAGQGIAAVGCTGICTGPHVHFEVRVRGAAVDPMTGL